MYCGYYENRCVCTWTNPPIVPWKGMRFQIDDVWFEVESLENTDVYLKLG